MANSFAVVKHWSDTKVIWALLTIKLSGSVPIGGEILNLGSSTALKCHPAAVPLAVGNPLTGNGSTLGIYELYLIPGTNMSNGKLSIVNYANGAILQPGQAYPTSVTADTFNLLVTLRKYVDLG